MGKGEEGQRGALRDLEMGRRAGNDVGCVGTGAEPLSMSGSSLVADGLGPKLVWIEMRAGETSGLKGQGFE